MASELIGTQLDHYFLLSRIGTGGSAVIYRAHDARDDRYVALKVLPRHFAENHELYRSFVREAQMAARLTHPHILPVYEYGEADGVPYIAMRLVDGGTLDSFVREGPLPLPFIARVLGDIAGALDYAHAEGVIHRDLKPDNILFDAEGTLYLGDFGVAHDGDNTGAQTNPADFTGTAAYASPEQCRGEPLTASADIYSLGVLLFEMLTGRRPFTGPTPLAVMYQHLGQPAPNPLLDRPDLPPMLADVMHNALAKEPATRYRSAGALSAALNRALATQPHAAEDAPPPPTSAPPPRWAEFPIWLLLTMIAIAFVAALLLVLALG